MATNDVPGAVPANNDYLHVGCWAEHECGDLIFVEGLEKGPSGEDKVIFVMFDMQQDPVVEYRDAMEKKAFEKHFTWKPGVKDSIKWTWHDKSAFPWDRIMQATKPKPKVADVEDQLGAAAKVAKTRRLKGGVPKSLDDYEDIDDEPIGAAARVARERNLSPSVVAPDFIKSMIEGGKKAAVAIWNGVQKAIGQLRE